MGHHDSETVLVADTFGAFYVETMRWWGSYYVKMAEEQYVREGGEAGAVQEHVNRSYDELHEAVSMHIRCVRSALRRPGASTG